MPNVLTVDGKTTECIVSEQDLRIVTQDRKPKESSIALDDVIVIEKNDVALNASIDQSKSTKPKWLCKIHYITRKKLVWKQTTLCISGQVVECQRFLSDLQLHFQKVYDQRPKRFLVLVNPISGGRYGQSNSKRVMPMFERAGITCDVKVSERAKHFEEIVTEYDLSTVDGIVIFGGDGSFSEVLNRLLRISHDKAGANFNDINGPFIPCALPIGVIPSGTGNGISVTQYGNYDVVTAALHIIKGNTFKIPLAADYSAGELIGYGSVVTAYGLFGDMMYYTDKKRWMRRARYAIMPFYLLFLKTPRLFNAEITVIGSQLNEEDSEKEEKMEGEFSNVAFFPAQVFGKAKGDWFALIFRRCSGLDVMRLMVKMLNREMLQEGEISSVTIRQPSRVRIKVNPKDLGDRNFLNYLMNVDGEIHTMKQADVTVKSLPNAISVYSSLHLYPPDSVSPPHTSTSAPSSDGAVGP